ncbi:DUF6153 family protein [Microbacterium jejuense]|uniref:DUF6153 family protein n=1 Tax=Microbacterium jejuense TaxID=1263637 RepID=UPI0031EB4165
MPHPHVLPRLGAMIARTLVVAAVILGLLGMHVLMSPGAHGAHGGVSGGASAASATHHDAAHVPAAPAMAESVAAVARPAGDGTGAPGGVWAVVCALALLLAALVAVRPSVFWRDPRSGRPRVAAAWRVLTDRGPRHPPSLIALSISRT